MKDNQFQGRTFVMADIHGAARALRQCFERSGFNKEKDRLIQLGDIADGWNEVHACVEELLSIKNLISIKGNHDDWFLEWIVTGTQPAGWQQGGRGTLESYCNYHDKDYHQSFYSLITSLIPEDLDIRHIEFFKNQQLYYIDENRNCFVHGGFNRHHTMADNEEYEATQFYWDRDLWMSALSFKEVATNGDHELGKGWKPKFKMKEDFKEVFIGHTATQSWRTDQPMHAANIWNLDTGAGFKGRLTMMNLETHEIFQSDPVKELYPEQSGRN